MSASHKHGSSCCYQEVCVEEISELKDASRAVVVVYEARAEAREALRSAARLAYRVGAATWEDHNKGGGHPVERCVSCLAHESLRLALEKDSATP